MESQSFDKSIFWASLGKKKKSKKRCMKSYYAEIPCFPVKNMSSNATQCNDEAVFYGEVLSEGGQDRYNSNV